MKIYPSDWNQPKYIIHIIMVTVIALVLISLFTHVNMLALNVIVLSIIAIYVSDVLTHSILKMQ